jgi:hypothetical protein
MDIYLPIAEVSLDVFVLLGLGAAVGFLSGVFGVGGGFLLTPLLIFIGVPPAVAVASSANQRLAPRCRVWRTGGAGNVDSGWALRVAGGLPARCSGYGVYPGQRAGQIELTISICYVPLLGTLIPDDDRSVPVAAAPAGGCAKIASAQLMHGLP